MMPSIQVLFEDNHLIAVNKPAGWLVHGDETGDAPLSDFVKFYIKERYDKPGDVFLGVIHRIDRPVSGVVVFARTSKALRRMNQLFKDRQVQKNYLALVESRPKELKGHLEHYIAKDRKRNKARASVRNRSELKGAKLGKLDYAFLGSIANHHILQVAPKTGRPHQIRVQLSSMGCAIRGDVKYGASAANDDGRIHLHARSLSFVHPVRKEPVEIIAPLPDEQLWNTFRHFAPDSEL